MESGLLCLFPSKHLRNCFARVLLFHPILVESATQRFFDSVFQQAQTFALTAVNGENFEVTNLTLFLSSNREPSARKIGKIFSNMRWFMR